MMLAPCTNRFRWYVALAATILATMSGAPLAEDTGHGQFHDSHYRHWKQPGTNISCCSDQDCTPAKAELRQGQWFAQRLSAWHGATDEIDRSVWLPLRQS